MARAHRELITIEFKHNTDHYSEYQITESEAESLFFALQEVLDIDWGFGSNKENDCREHAAIGDTFTDADTGKTQIYGEDGWRTVYNNTTTVRYDLSSAMVEGEIRDKLIEMGWKPPGKPVVKSEWETLVDALKSIATSSCCGDCEEAKRVAEVALYEAEVVSSIPVRGTYGDIRQCPETLKTQIKTEDGWKELYGEPNTYDWKQEYSHMYWTLKDLLKRSKGATDIAKVVNELEKIHATFPNPTKV